jgi:hypothetical protein
MMVKMNSFEALNDPTYLQQLIQNGEGAHLEFKIDLPAKDPTQVLAKNIAAFANSTGGVILFGVNDHGEVLGVEHPEIICSSIEATSQLFRPRINTITSGICKVAEKNLVYIGVQQSPLAPVAVKGHFYKRTGGMVYRLTAEEIRHILSDRSQSVELFLSESDLKKFLLSADEDTLTEILVVPLLRSFGFETVSSKGHTDKSLEYGQDVRGFKYQLPTGHWLYFAAQVKTGQILYSPSRPTRNIETILSQVRMAFKKKMFDAQIATYSTPDNVFFIASGEIVEGARQYLYEQLDGERARRILFWDSHLIIESCFKKGLPKGMQLEIKNYLMTENG